MICCELPRIVLMRGATAAVYPCKNKYRATRTYIRYIHKHTQVPSGVSVHDAHKSYPAGRGSPPPLWSYEVRLLAMHGVMTPPPPPRSPAGSCPYMPPQRQKTPLEFSGIKGSVLSSKRPKGILNIRIYTNVGTAVVVIFVVVAVMCFVNASLLLSLFSASTRFPNLLAILD